MGDHRKAVRITVRGNVQGVGYRSRARWAAESEGVVGWSSNEPDGTVLIHAEGSEHRVDQFVKKLREGFVGIHVSRIELGQAPVEDLRNFEIID